MTSPVKVNLAGKLAFIQAQISRAPPPGPRSDCPHTVNSLAALQQRVGPPFYAVGRIVALTIIDVRLIVRLQVSATLAATRSLDTGLYYMFN